MSGCLPSAPPNPLSSLSPCLLLYKAGQEGPHQQGVERGHLGCEDPGVDPGVERSRLWALERRISIAIRLNVSKT